MSRSTSELRLPARPEYIIVAKRAAAGFAAVAGLHLEAVEDVVIAVAQACEHALTRLHDLVGEDCGQLRIEFAVTDGRLDVQVRTVCSRSELEHRREQRAVEEQRRALERARAQHQLAVQLMGLFVDDFGYRDDEKTGGIHVRLTKYRVS